MTRQQHHRAWLCPYEAVWTLFDVSNVNTGRFAEEKLEDLTGGHGKRLEIHYLIHWGSRQPDPEKRVPVGLAMSLGP